MGFNIYPAIDMIGGKCVRLKQGDYKQVTTYNDDPKAVACEFAKMGAKLIHVVDLDAAKNGGFNNKEALIKVLSVEGLKVETGGGVRSFEDIEARLSIGVERVIIGTKAVKEPEFVVEAIKRYGAEHIVAGLDGRNGMAATHGWEKESNVSILELAKDYADNGLKYVIYTDISRDGMLTGPDLSFTEQLVKETGLQIIASGGISCEDDITQVKRIGCEGVIVGKAYYEGKVDLKKMFDLHRE